MLEGTGTRLLDTRKTTPCMRIFEKYAVRIGGGQNHRYNLSDGVLLKDNHIDAAGGVREAVTAAKAYAPFVRRIEVETENLDMVKEAVDAGADIIMLDNMTLEQMAEAIRYIDCLLYTSKLQPDYRFPLLVYCLESGQLTRIIFVCPCHIRHCVYGF